MRGGAERESEGVGAERETVMRWKGRKRKRELGGGGRRRENVIFSKLKGKHSLESKSVMI